MTEAAPLPLESLALPRPGERVGRYRVVREIGRGAMGVVFEVIHEKLERPCALKLLRPLATQDEGAVRRFEREAKILARLSSPNLVHVLDVDRTEGGVPYLVMELLAGETLEERLATGPVPLTEALAIVFDLCAGAEAAHAEGVVHRDLKPSNVILTKSGAKIVDFGVAAFMGGSMDGSTASVAGTPRTMSPEQLLGERVGPASDVFAIGVVAYRTIAGRYPFEAESMAAQMLAIMKGHVPLAEVAEVSASVSNVIGRALARDPADRIASASALAEALREAIEVGPPEEEGKSLATSAAPEPAVGAPSIEPTAKERGVVAPAIATMPTRSPSPTKLAAFAITVLAAAGGLSMLVRASDSPPPQPSPTVVVTSAALPQISPSTSPSLAVTPIETASAASAPPATAAPASASASSRAFVPPRPSNKPIGSRAEPPAAPAPPNGSGFPPHL